MFQSCWRSVLLNSDKVEVGPRGACGKSVDPILRAMGRHWRISRGVMIWHLIYIFTNNPSCPWVRLDWRSVSRPLLSNETFWDDGSVYICSVQCGSPCRVYEPNSNNLSIFLEWHCVVAHLNVCPEPGNLAWPIWKFVLYLWGTAELPACPVEHGLYRRLRLWVLG